MLKLLVLLAVGSIAFAQEHLSDLQLVANVAEAMLDGDICLHIETPRSIRYSTLQDPRDRWSAADNYDVNDAAFTQTKKVLIRLAHLCPETCDVNLWMPMPERSDRIAIVIRNVHEISQFWQWGDLNQEMPSEMKHVLEKGERVTVHRKPLMVSVLAPVHDGLGRVVAIAEVVTQKVQDPRENVK
jgi:hypothetical protein